jgi:rhamnosyltransferase
MLKVAGVTILYNPDQWVISNIDSYLFQLDLLYILDNSENINSAIINQLKSREKIKIIPNSENIGIAAALNKSSEMAIHDGYDLLLTLDQDSRVSDDLVTRMIVEFEKDEKIGLISPFVVHIQNPRTSANSGLEKIMVAMTSGSIIRLNAYKKTGEFLEKFFIDYVDNEFCLRLTRNGFKIFQLNSVSLYHKLGNTSKKKIIFREVFPTNHSPLRWYYRTRNRLYVYKKYGRQFPKYVFFDLKVFIKDFIKILLFENGKFKKMKMILYGFIDFCRHKYGKI